MRSSGGGSFNPDVFWAFRRHNADLTTITFGDVVLPLKGLQVADRIAPVRVDMVDFPTVIGITVAVLVACNPRPAGVLAPLVGIAVLDDAAFIPDRLDFWFCHVGLS